MATRALIGFLDDDKQLVGTYNHYDGYPEGLGKTLIKVSSSGINKLPVDDPIKIFTPTHPGTFSSSGKKEKFSGVAPA